MDAFDKLPKSVRQELAVALLDYTAIDFHYHYRQGMQPPALLEILWKANIRDHIAKVKTGEVAPIPLGHLNSYRFTPDPIREGRNLAREARLSRLRELNPMAGRT